jgi:cyanate permease
MAFVQGGGYIIASIMPFTVGWLRGHSGDLSKACFMIAVGIGLLTGFAMRFSRRTHCLRAFANGRSQRSTLQKPFRLI